MLRRVALPGFIVCVAVLVGSALLSIRSIFYLDAIDYGGSFSAQIESVNWDLEIGLVTGNTPSGRIGWRREAIQSSVLAHFVRLYKLGPIYFDLYYRRLPQSQLHTMGLVFPIWVLMIASGGTGYACLRLRGEARWTLREDVQKANPRLRRRMALSLFLLPVVLLLA